MLNQIILENLDKLNSITKYPSIYTYHELGNRGILNKKVLVEINESLKGYISEKVDGTNSRIILSKDDYIIGSRENLLYSKGDRIVNNTMDIANKLIPVADKLLCNNEINDNEIIVVYGEVFGGNIGRNKKNYTNSNKVGYRVFDVAIFDKDSINELLSCSLDKISQWRENSGQNFINIDYLNEFCIYNKLDKVPSLAEVDINNLPTDVKGMYSFMSKFENTLVGLDTTGKSEGIVIRSNDRKYIRKIRFEEYRKTLKIK